MPEQSTIAANIQVRLKMPTVKTLATGRATQGDHVPVKQTSIALQVDARGELGLGRTEHDGFLGQPFQGGAGLHGEFQLLIGRAAGAIPLGRAGAGQLRPGAFGDMRADVQSVTAGNPAGRVHDDVLAHFGAFGVQVLLHPQRAMVATHHRAGGVADTGVAAEALAAGLGAALINLHANVRLARKHASEGDDDAPLVSVDVVGERGRRVREEIDAIRVAVSGI